MKLVRSDSPEVARSIGSTGTLACWGWSLPTIVCIASAPGMLVALIVSLIVSVRAAAWLGVPVALALNGYLLWRARSRRLNWVIAGGADQIFVRSFVQRGRGRAGMREPDVIMFEASEIASMRSRIVEVFLYGPKPKSIEWLVIESKQVIAQGFSDQIRSLLNADNPGKQVYVTNEEGCLTMNWEWCRPALRVFLLQVARECPSVLIAPEERSELDLNGVWHGLRGGPDAHQRRMLVQAKRLGFGCECQRLLSLYRRIPRREVSAYMAQIEQEEARTERSAVQK